MNGFAPDNCPHCALDRRIRGEGGWIQQENNGPLVACPVCNPGGDRERAWKMAELQRDQHRQARIKETLRP